MLSLAEDGGLLLPLDAITETFAILAMRRVGKSNAAVVLAEEMHAAGLPFVVIDPKGDWWGIKADGDGSAGLPVVIFGGDHADVPLEPTAGAFIADLIATERISCVLDVSTMDRPDLVEFLHAFAVRLLKRNRDPLHVICEEADDYIPQEKHGNELALVRAFSRLIRHGGFKGIGCTVITQRPALVSKHVLSQIGTLIVLRVSHPLDQKAITDWCKGHPLLSEISESLSSLPVGKGWVISPVFLDTTRQVRFRRRATFDSGTTPKVGDTRREPTSWADVDLARVRGAMADTIERAEADDPAALRARIEDLERQLTVARNDVPAPERIEVPVLPTSMADDLGEILDTFQTVADRAMAALTRWPAETATYHASLPETQPTDLSGVTMTPAAPPAARRPLDFDDAPETPTVPLRKVDRAILTVLAQWQPDGRTAEQIALLAGYSPTSGSYAQALARLRKGDLIAGRGPISHITPQGINSLGAYTPLPTGPALLDWWRSRLSRPAAAALDVFIDAAREGYDDLDITLVAGRAGYSATSGSFAQALAKLRTLGLVKGWTADPDFVKAVTS